MLLRHPIFQMRRAHVLPAINCITTLVPQPWNWMMMPRQSLSLLDEGHRFVMVETVKRNAAASSDLSDAEGARLTRYQLHNHLGSAALELDDDAATIVKPAG